MSQRKVRLPMLGEAPQTKAATALRASGAGRGRFCHKPFDFFEVDVGGKAWVCCEDWLPLPIGDLDSSTFAEVWNSQAAQDIRRSILDGSYRYCDSRTCPDLDAGTLPLLDEVSDPHHREIIDRELTALTKGPRTVNLGYDNSCNLRCPSCRSGIISLKGEALAKAARMQDKIANEALVDVEQLIITGHGDALASKLFRKLLQTLDAEDHPRLSITLMTNGLLFTPALWATFAKIQPAVNALTVSVDAASAATYAVNRAGGSFEVLLRNLEFASRLRRDGSLGWFEMSFVVQANNYREMSDFVLLARRLGCDSALFMKILHWDGTYSEEQYACVAIHEPSHPEHGAFLEVLKDSIFDDECVDLSNLTSLRARRAAMGPAAGRPQGLPPPSGAGQ